MYLTRQLAVVTVLVSTSCGGGDPHALLDVQEEAAGENCADGGQKLTTGIDENGNGKLDKAEVSDRSYVCDGAHGADGKTGPAGEKGDPGDAGDMGALGATGAPGAKSLLRLTDEPSGDNCQAGGTRVEAGIDANDSSVLEPTEVSETSYVCHASAGFSAVQVQRVVNPQGEILFGRYVIGYGDRFAMFALGGTAEPLYVYKNNGADQFVLEDEIRPQEAVQIGDAAGMNDDTIVIGSRLGQKAFIFTYDESAGWEETQELNVSVSSADFGAFARLDEHMVVGGSSELRFYERQGTGDQWAFRSTVTPPTNAVFYDVAIDGDRAVSVSGGGVVNETLHFYERNTGTGQWSESGSIERESFSGPLAINGDLLAARDGDKLTIFEHTGTDWIQSGLISQTTTESAAIMDGIVYSGDQDAAISGEYSGVVHAFWRDSGTHYWERAGSFSADDPTAGARFGSHIAAANGFVASAAVWWLAPGASSPPSGAFYIHRVAAR